MPRQSNSSDAVGLLTKLRYSAELFAMRLRMPGGHEAARAELAELRGYVDDFEKRTGFKAADSVVVELGFGARPRRAFMLSGLFREVYAIDLDAPLLSTSDVLRASMRNGAERAVKSMVRHLAFERKEWNRFHAAMRDLLPGYNPGKVHFELGSVGDHAVWRSIPGMHLALSIDVFEHVPRDELAKALEILREKLVDGGLVITRPMVFTGIAGGHDLDWYPHKVDDQRSDAAWGHLTDPDFRVNSYLNRLRRSDFRQMFEAAGFAVERDHTPLGRLGEQHMTERKRQELASWSDYELFSNQVEFHLT